MGPEIAIGRLVVEDDGAGVYIGYLRKEHHVTNRIEYFASETNCDYEWIQSERGDIIENAVSYKSDVFTFYIGRTIAFGSVQVGKVALEHSRMYYGHNGKEYETYSYDVLVCNPPQILELLEPSSGRSLGGSLKYILIGFLLSFISK